MAGYPFRMTGSSRGVPDSRPCLDFGQVCQRLSFRGARQREPGMTAKDYVSTSPVLDPLAAESFRPCGSAR
jgi:hypothetical protein